VPSNIGRRIAQSHRNDFLNGRRKACGEECLRPEKAHGGPNIKTFVGRNDVYRNQVRGRALLMRLLTIRTIVVATDLDPSSDAALDSANRLAAAAGATLHVVHVVAPSNGSIASSPSTPDVADAVREATERADVSEGAVIHVVAGSPADAIRSVAHRAGADVVVIGPHRERSPVVGGHPLGGTARSVAELSVAPCLVAARPIRLPLERVLVSIDLSETARGTLLAALSWASALRVGSSSDRQTTLIVLHVETAADDGADEGTTTSIDRELERVHAVAGAWAGVTVRQVTETSTNAARAIIDRAVGEQADLVVLGTRERGLGEEPRLGSVSAAVSTMLALPSLLVPPPVWRAHVSELETTKDVTR
jgi:nucleotide-binding universal stress UspA family protein